MPVICSEELGLRGRSPSCSLDLLSILIQPDDVSLRMTRGKPLLWLKGHSYFLSRGPKDCLEMSYLFCVVTCVFREAHCHQGPSFILQRGYTTCPESVSSGRKEEK